MMRLAIGEVDLTVGYIDPIFTQLVPEILGAYDFESIPWRKGDVVLDVGAHQGIVSCYLARRWPGIRVIAFEPEPDNYEKMLVNIAANELKSRVRPYPLAVTASGLDFPMRHGTHSAESTGYFRDYSNGAGGEWIALATSIPQILRLHRLERVRLLKLDCEGAEHEILAASDDWIDRIDYLRGEIHMIPVLRDQGYTAAGTMARFPAERAGWQIIENCAQI